MTESDTLEYIFGIEYEMICEINNENFYKNINEYYQLSYYCYHCYQLLYPAPACTSQSTIVLNENGIRKPEIDTVDCILFFCFDQSILCKDNEKNTNYAPLAQISWLDTNQRITISFIKNINGIMMTI